MKNWDIFAWILGDMLGIDLDFLCHRLFILYKEGDDWEKRNEGKQGRKLTSCWQHVSSRRFNTPPS
ncbi:hypothetical protein CR513_51983, partial [Mucuna pruriens]